MTASQFDNLVHDEWKLRELVNAHERVQRSVLSYDDAKALLEDSYRINSWLSAERHWNLLIRNWLSAETRWEKTKALIGGHRAFTAAERGWLAMRELAPSLDGVGGFEQLSPILRDRYAVFAAAALGIELDFEPVTKPEPTTMLGRAIDGYYDD